MVKNYPYTVKTGSLKEFLTKATSLGVPQKVSQSYLSSIGFTSTNDRAIIQILKFLKFLDGSGIPTERYAEYRDKGKSKKVLGEAIRNSYSNLFETYPEAENEKTLTLQNYFNTKTGLGERTVKAVTETFRALVSMADIQKKSETLVSHEEIAEEFRPLGKVSLIINSPMGKNIIEANTKEEFKQLQEKISKMWIAIEAFWPDKIGDEEEINIHPSTKAEEKNTDVNGSVSSG